MEIIEPEFNIGDIVYLKTDPDQLARIVIGIFVYPGGIYYTTACGTNTYNAYEVELSHEPNQNLKLGIDINYSKK